MTLSKESMEQVRKRASFACEYCGVTETDVGGQLTVDHFQPRVHDGTDELDNLLYCCSRCNLYKSDYWPLQTNDTPIWNPRHESAETHFLLLADGTLYPITTMGAFTIARLRLNRPPLVEHRIRNQAQMEAMRLLARYREIVELLEQLQRQHARLLQEHGSLLEQQRTLLRLLLLSQREE